MTVRETERLAKVETKVDDIKDDISEMKADIKKLLENQGDFINKKAVYGALTFVVGLIGALWWVK